MKFRQFRLAMALMLVILAMHVLTLRIPTSSYSTVDVTASVNGALAYFPRKTTILENIALSGANLDKRHLSANTNLDSFLEIFDNKIACLPIYDRYIDRQQPDGSGVLDLDYIDEGTPPDTSAMSTPTVDVYDENGYLIVHSYTLSIDGGPEENTPSGLLEAGLAIAALVLRQLFGTDESDTQANPSFSASASSLISGPGPAPLLVKRNSADGVWGGKSWIISALLGASFVLFMLASCCFRHRREENTRNDMEYNYRRHEEINQQAYAHQQREFGRLRRAGELNQLHYREIDRSRWHREACAGPNRTHDDAADPPSAAELSGARRRRSQLCRACRSTRATQTSTTDDSILVDIDLQEPPQIYRAYTHTRHDDLPHHEDGWVEAYPVRYPVRRDSSLSSCSRHAMKTGCIGGRGL